MVNRSQKGPLEEKKRVRISFRAPDKQRLNAQNHVLKGTKKNPDKTWTSFRQMTQPFTRPVIRKFKNDWYVEFYYNHPETFKPVRFRARAGINRIKDLKEREQAITELCANMDYALRHLDYNPFAQDEALKLQFAELRELEEKIASRWTVAEAVEKFMAFSRKKELSKASLHSYTNYTNALLGWIEKHSFQELNLCELDEPLFERLVEELRVKGSWSPRTYNNYVKFYKCFFANCERLERKGNKEVVYKMSFEDVVLKVSKAEKNKYFSGHMADLVKAELKLHPQLDLFSKWIYYTCLRPKELANLKIEHVDLKGGQIKVIGQVAKEAERFLPICTELRELIEETKLMEYPHYYHIFGTYGEPADKPFHKDYFSKRFKKIREQLKMDVNYTLYGWKHTRVIDLIKAGYKDREVMDLTGHRDTKSFDTYKRELMANPDSRLDGKTVQF